MSFVDTIRSCFTRLEQLQYTTYADNHHTNIDALRKIPRNTFIRFVNRQDKVAARTK